MGARLVGGAGVATAALAVGLFATGFETLPVVVVGVGGVLVAGLWWSEGDEEPEPEPGPEYDPEATYAEFCYCPRCGAMEREGRSTCRFCGGDL
jgi:hypothetical protein